MGRYGHQELGDVGSKVKDTVEFSFHNELSFFRLSVLICLFLGNSLKISLEIKCSFHSKPMPRHLLCSASDAF